MSNSVLTTDGVTIYATRLTPGGDLEFRYSRDGGKTWMDHFQVDAALTERDARIAELENKIASMFDSVHPEFVLSQIVAEQRATIERLQSEIAELRQLLCCCDGESPPDPNCLVHPIARDRFGEPLNPYDPNTFKRPRHD